MRVASTSHSQRIGRPPSRPRTLSHVKITVEEYPDEDHPERPAEPEVGLGFPREWLEFPDPDDPDHVIHADLTWLLARWRCVFGDGCQGVVAGRSTEGCCSHGAFFTDANDEKRVRGAVRRLTRVTWQRCRRGFANYTELDTIDGTNPARRTATTPDGPCVFLNDPDFGEGVTGCALHVQALRDGLAPMAYKPDVCWQLPIRRDQEWRQRPDGTKVLVSKLGEFDRRCWGEGGHDLHWWCTGAPRAHRGSNALYQDYERELTELVGAAGFSRLAELCAARLRLGLVAPHPATVAANVKLSPDRAERSSAPLPPHHRPAEADQRAADQDGG